jgi:RNA polymerase sigma-70 factor (sigma-E family)
MGDRPDFSGFVAARSGALLRTAFLLTGDWASAEDLLQASLAKCWRSWSRVSDRPDAYVRKVIVNTYVSWRRRRWHGETPASELPEVVVGDRTSEIDDREALWLALRRLPRRQRAVVVLRYFDDMTEAETAVVLGIRVGTVKSQCSKALAALRVDPDLQPDLDRGEVPTHVVD